MISFFLSISCSFFSLYYPPSLIHSFLLSIRLFIFLLFLRPFFLTTAPLTFVFFFHDLLPFLLHSFFGHSSSSQYAVFLLFSYSTCSSLPSSSFLKSYTTLPSYAVIPLSLMFLPPYTSLLRLTSLSLPTLPSPFSSRHPPSCRSSGRGRSGAT